MITIHYIAEKIDGWLDENTEPRSTEQLIADMATQSGMDRRVIRLRAHRLASQPDFGA